MGIMKILKKLLIAMVMAAVPLAAVQAGPMDKPVAARKADMKLRAFYMGQLGGMAKGKIAYDAKVAQGAANSLLALTKLDGSKMWPMGSGNDKLGDMTRAKPEIWSTYPEVAGKGKAYKMAVENLAKAAGSGLDALKGAIGPVGKGCGGCHKPFREKKKK